MRSQNPATNRFCGQCGTQLEHANNAATNTANHAETGDSIDGAPANSGAAAPSRFDIVIDREGIEPENTAPTGFLGLFDHHTVYYIDEEKREPRSHLRRNIALLVVAVALGLTALQWRSIRDYGLRQISLAFAPTEAQSPAASVVANSHAPGLPLAPAVSDAPQVLESGPGANHAPLVQQTGNSLESAPPANSNPSSDAVRPRAMGARAAGLRDQPPLPPSIPSVSKPLVMRTASRAPHSPGIRDETRRRCPRCRGPRRVVVERRQQRQPTGFR